MPAFLRALILVVAVHICVNASSQVQYTFKFKFGTKGSGEGKFFYPYGIAINKNGDIYVADMTNNGIQIFDSVGNFKSYFISRDQFVYPGRLLFDKSDNLYVAYPFANMIQKYDTAGNLLAQVGECCMGPGKLNNPTGMTFDGSGNLHVVDFMNNQMQVFDSNLVYKWRIELGAPGFLSGPRGIGIDHQGYFYVADAYYGRVNKFNVYGRLASFSQAGKGDSDLDYPMDLLLDKEDFIYVADGNDKVKIFTTDGRLITWLGGTGDGDGQFNNPVGIVLDNKRNLYVADQENGRIQVFSFGSYCKNIPNLITPNSDGKNDTWVLRDLPQNCEVSLYNSWGSLIYNTRDYKNDWWTEEAGTYFYYINTIPNACKGWLQVVK